MTDGSSPDVPTTARFINPETMHRPTGYTHVVEVTGGRPVYIAGQVALDPTGALVGPGDVRAQARQVFDNLRLALQAVGATFEQVVKLNYLPRGRDPSAGGPRGPGPVREPAAVASEHGRRGPAAVPR
jgi:enamine deaminase RidA (YjgF/YER057c/UK114 family)